RSGIRLHCIGSPEPKAAPGLGGVIARVLTGGAIRSCLKERTPPRRIESSSRSLGAVLMRLKILAVLFAPILLAACESSPTTVVVQPEPGQTTVVVPPSNP